MSDPAFRPLSDGMIAQLWRTPTRLPVLRRISPRASVWTTTGIVGTLLAACVAAAGHHFTLAYVDGRPIGSTTEQFWIKTASNAFGYIVGVALGFVTTQTLAQAVWKAASTQSIRISTLDDLFALPSPPALLRLALTRPWTIHFLPPILHTLFFHLLVVIGIFAPNALTTTSSARRRTSLVVPTLDLSRGPITYISYPDLNQYTNVTVEWRDLIFSLVNSASSQAPIRLSAIEGCAVECGYSLQYDAPALDCRDLAEAEVGIRPFHAGDSGRPIIYASNTSLYPVTAVDGSYDLGVPYAFNISYAAVHGQQADGSPNYTSPVRGVTCQFRKGTYMLDVRLRSQQQQTMTTKLLVMGDVLGGDTTCQRSTILERDDDGGGDCWTRGVNYRALGEMFARAFSGTIDYHLADPASNATTLGGNGKPYFSRNLQNERAVASMFVAYEPDEMAFDLSPTLVNADTDDSNPLMDNSNYGLKEALASTMANVTLGLIAQRSDVIKTSVEVWDGESVWLFTARTLWAVYTPALVVAGMLAVYGTWCIHASSPGTRSGDEKKTDGGGVALDASFSTILLATRGRGVDRLCSKAETLEDVLEAQLCYSRRDAVFVYSAR